MLYGSSIADHANLLNYRNLEKRVNNQMKQDLENLKNWLKQIKFA